jgi:hypothetical protein
MTVNESWVPYRESLVVQAHLLCYTRPPVLEDNVCRRRQISGLLPVSRPPEIKRDAALTTPPHPERRQRPVRIPVGRLHMQDVGPVIG